MTTTPDKGWHLVTVHTVGPIVTIADLVQVTGLSRRTVRDMLALYEVRALPRYDPRDVLKFQRHHVLAAIVEMPGKGKGGKRS